MRAAGFTAHSFTRPAKRAATLALAAAVAVAGGAAVGVGCNRAEAVTGERPGERLEGPPERMELAWEERGIPGAPAATPVMIKEGPAPLVYLSDRAATLRVVERSGGEEVLAEGAVGARTIVRVDAQSGIVFGGRTLLAGPLPGRRYAIYLVPTGDSFSRFGESRPVRRAEPGSEVDVTEPEPAPEPAD